MEAQPTATPASQSPPFSCCSSKNKAFCSLGCLILLIVVAAGSFLLGKYSARPKTDPTSNWKTYTNEKFGIYLKYPKNWGIESSGPNFAMAQLIEGQTISGTVEPSYDTIKFSDETKKEIFSLGIFQPYTNNLSVQEFKEGYLYTHGPCDTRWGFEAKEIANISVAGKQFLKVDGFDKSQRIICYYGKNNNDNLITIGTFANIQDKDLSILGSVLSTFKFSD